MQRERGQPRPLPPGLCLSCDSLWKQLLREVETEASTINVLLMFLINATPITKHHVYMYISNI